MIILLSLVLFGVVLWAVVKGSVALRVAAVVVLAGFGAGMALFAFKAGEEFAETRFESRDIRPPSPNDATGPMDEEPALSTGQDDYKRVLSIAVSDLASEYKLGESIPITVKITNLGSKGGDTAVRSAHATAQLFPHLTVWVEKDGQVSVERLSLRIENRIWIKQGQSFERIVDLSHVPALSFPGEYIVSIGHQNSIIKDYGDWTGTLRSRRQKIRINRK